MQDSKILSKKKRGRPKKSTLKNSSEEKELKKRKLTKLKKKSLSIALKEEDEFNEVSFARNVSEYRVISSKKPKKQTSSSGTPQKQTATKRENMDKEFKIKKKIKKDNAIKQNPSPFDLLKQSQQEKDRNSKTRVPLNLPRFNINKQFYDILSLSNKDEDFLMMVSNILTTGSRQLNDKRITIRKKRTALQGSNLSQQEYLKKEKELLKSEKEEIEEIKTNLINKLSSSKIKGFETKEIVIENLKLQKLEEIKNNEIEFEINEEEFEELKNMQMELLDKLLEERSFVNPDLKLSKFKSLSEKINLDEENRLKFSVESQKFDNFYENKNNQDLRRPDHNKKTILMNKYLEEGEIVEKDYLNEKMKEIFNDFEHFSKINKDDAFIMSKYEKATLLELKSDFLYIEEGFQKYQFLKYQKILKEIEENGEFDLKKIGEKTLHELITLTTYVLNNVHYFQKFKTSSDFINPYDLLYVLEKIK